MSSTHFGYRGQNFEFQILNLKFELFDQGFISMVSDAWLPIEFGLNIYERFN